MRQIVRSITCRPRHVVAMPFVNDGRLRRVSLLGGRTGLPGAVLPTVEHCAQRLDEISITGPAFASPNSGSELPHRGFENV